MKIDLPLGSSVTDPFKVLEEDIESVRCSYQIAKRIIDEIREGLKPFGIFVDVYRTEDELVVRPKDVGGMKIWLSSFSFEVVLSQSHDYIRLCRVSAMTRPYFSDWEITVSAGEKARYRRRQKTKVGVDELGRVTLEMIIEVDRQAGILKPAKVAS